MRNRRWLRALSSALALAGSAAVLSAADEMVEIEVRFVKATKAQIAAIFPPELPLPQGDPGDQPGILMLAGVLSAEQMARSLSGLKKSGAEILNAPRTVAVIGHRARIQNVREFRYPSKYSDPDKDGKVVPIAFETNPVGIVMELEPKIGAGGTIDLRISPKITELIGYSDFTGTASPKSSASPVWLPRFWRREISTEVTLSPGSTVLLSGLGERSDARSDFIFVTARILRSP